MRDEYFIIDAEEWVEMSAYEIEQYFDEMRKAYE